MDRSYIICHMVTSLDGRVTGEFLGKSAYSGERYSPENMRMVNK